ncbi:glycosyltransferase family protein [Natronogracilivirga saccharolytica]|uniref:Glycosyl transferase n=1 Tax=Natronogracilivirga saccharolytica TaxID=2812953 RepID=A0A8J7RK75_9BACT|nr:glycosyltransferase family protein [Natronogracilivirga saccharolytica]MBP3192330.1 hypothetical protein [Natronogracilivirga saccharolytica]
MKLLYGIQGTGNGHISRARTFLPEFRKHAEVDILISGHSYDCIPGEQPDYNLKGLSYAFGKNGGIDFLKSIYRLRPLRFLQDIHSLDTQKYDLVISDFEPISAWSARRAGIPSVGLSHQASFLSDLTPRPKKRSIAGEAIFSWYAPCDYPAGFHYLSYEDFIYPPVIREEIRNLRLNLHSVPQKKLYEREHATVYLPAYHESVLMKYLKNITDIDWHVFSKTADQPGTYGHIHVYPVSEDGYLNSLSSASYVLCGAGFEAPSEAIYLGIPLLVIPMRGQYEQWCNAAALQKMGVPVIEYIGDRFCRQLSNWLSTALSLRIRFPDLTGEIAENVLDRYGSVKHVRPA